jgi:hypothetical protein
MFVRKERQRDRLQVRLQNRALGEVAPSQYVYRPTLVRKAGSILRAGRRAEDAHDLAMEKAQHQGRNKLHNRLVSRFARERELFALSSDSEAPDDGDVDIDDEHDASVRCAEPTHTLDANRASGVEVGDGDCADDGDLTGDQHATGYDNAELFSEQALSQGTASLLSVAATATRPVPRRVSQLQNIRTECEMDDTTSAIMKNVICLMTKKDPVMWLQQPRAGYPRPRNG